MAELQTLYATGDSTETENSSQLTTTESVVDQNMYKEQLLPSTSAGLSRGGNRVNTLASVLPYATLRIRQTSQLPTEEHANAITSHLQLNSKLIQNDPESHKLRIETLKAMPQCLTIKRSVKSKLQATIAQKSKTRQITYWKWLKYRISYNISKIHLVITDSAPTLELWYHTIKLIEGQCGSGIAAYFKFLRWLICLNIMSCILSISFIVLPQSLLETHIPGNISIYDFLTGSGFFRDTIMYYGFYSNDTVDQVFGTIYSIPSAYFLTLLSCYILTLIVLSIKVASSYRKCYIEIRGKVQNIYSNKIFCGWDFSISSSKAANLQSASVYIELKELLAEAIQQSQLSFYGKFIAIVLQATVTIIVCAMICGTAMLLWVLLEKHKMNGTDETSVMIVPAVVTIIMQFFPAVISWLALLEKYTNKRTELYVTVIRIHAMGATIIGTLITFWMINTTSDCWQTKLGEEIYRLVLLDFIFYTFGMCIFHVTRFTLYSMGWKWIQKSEFYIARNTLNLIYNQTLFWLGFYFSPLMSVIILVKMIFILYVKKYGLLKFYQPPARPWRAAQTETLFLALAFLGIICVIMVLGYIITSIRSNDCGPFRDHENVWEFVIDRILSMDKGSTSWKIMSQLTSPGIGAVIIISMSVGVYCFRAKVEASKEMLQILREMLILQTRDKEFLMKSLSKFSNERTMSEQNCSPSKNSVSKHTTCASPIFSSGDSQETRRRNILPINYRGDNCV